MDLTEFLLARIDEDVQVARAAASDQGATWAAAGDEYVYPDPPPGNSFVATGPWDGGIGPAAPHIARHDPARILAECEAKRRIVEHAEPDLLAASPGDPYVLRLLALPYASHPDYDPAWRP